MRGVVSGHLNRHGTSIALHDMKPDVSILLLQPIFKSVTASLTESSSRGVNIFPLLLIRSTIPFLRYRGTRGGGLSTSKSKAASFGRATRRISNTSSKPLVVIRPTLAPFPSIIQLG